MLLNLRSCIKRNYLSPEEQGQLRQLMSTIPRYARLSVSATKFVVSRRVIQAVRHGQLIPLPLNRLEQHSIPHRQVVLGAMREVIGDQIAPLKKRGMHVDHVYPFIRLAEDWAQSRHVFIEDLRVINSRRLGRKSLGEELDASWAEYHRTNAELQLLTPQENLRKGSSVAT